MDYSTPRFKCPLVNGPSKAGGSPLWQNTSTYCSKIRLIFRLSSITKHKRRLFGEIRSTSFTFPRSERGSQLYITL